jgi:hypothetical protein
VVATSAKRRSYETYLSAHISQRESNIVGREIAEIELMLNMYQVGPDRSNSARQLEALERRPLKYDIAFNAAILQD